VPDPIFRAIVAGIIIGVLVIALYELWTYDHA
jgi:hypothetical protein